MSFTEEEVFSCIREHRAIISNASKVGVNLTIKLTSDADSSGEVIFYFTFLLIEGNEVVRDLDEWCSAMTKVAEYIRDAADKKVADALAALTKSEEATKRVSKQFDEACNMAALATSGHVFNKYLQASKDWKESEKALTAQKS